MDERRAWLKERRSAVQAAYDEEAATYDAHGYAVPVHVEFVRRLVDTCPPDGIILDAPCGTGPYFAIVTELGRRVVGLDQSAGMLAQASARGLAQATQLVGLQEIAFDRVFHGVMTIDGMEHVPPEEWPLVLANLHRSLRPGGHLYLTMEEIDQADIEAAFVDAQARGLPAVRGEVVEGDTAGYHFYPGRDRLLRWLTAEGLSVVEEGLSQHDGWAYRHLLLRDATSSQESGDEGRLHEWPARH